MKQGRPNSKEQIKKNKPLIFILAISLIVVIAVTIILVVSRTKNNEPDIDSRSFEEIFWDSETAEEAIATFQKKIDATTSPEQKAELYSERANTLFELFSTTELLKNKIISDLEESQNIYPSEETLYRLYDYNHFYKDFEKAEYYMNLYRQSTENDKKDQLQNTEG